MVVLKEKGEKNCRDIKTSVSIIYLNLELINVLCLLYSYQKYKRFS